MSWQAWSTIRVLDEARTWLFPLYASFATPAWLRSLGATIGKGVEASTVLMIPKLVTVGDGAFLADDTLIGGYELGGGWLRIDEVEVGKHAFVGNSGMAAPGRKVPKGGLVAVLSAAPVAAAPSVARRGSARRRPSCAALPARQTTSRTYAPSTGLKVARAVVEVCRLIAPITLVALRPSLRGRPALAGPDGLVAGRAGVRRGARRRRVAGGGLRDGCAKWALLGRLTAVRSPAVEFAGVAQRTGRHVRRVAGGTLVRQPDHGHPRAEPVAAQLGAKVGRGVWCETYWLPEADLIDLRAGVTVNAGCVVQTHLFHDRVLSMDMVTLRAGATLGPEQRDPARGHHRTARYDRPGIAGHARRIGS